MKFVAALPKVQVMKRVAVPPKLAVSFFRQEASGSEPVREWLKSLPGREKKAIGMDIMAAQFG